MRPSKLARTLVESNDSGKVYWVKVTIKHEGLPQDQWGSVFQRGRGVADEVCHEVGRVDMVA